MKAVMISIQPKMCELIANGEKTIEVRKTYPREFLEKYYEKQSDFFRNRPSYKIKSFKCYIYCTYGNTLADLSNCSCENIENDVKLGKISRYALQEHKIIKTTISSCAYGNGKVIGSFVCDRVEGISKVRLGSLDFGAFEDVQKSCLTEQQIYDYCQEKDIFYTWHISDLKIYDEPKKLGEFVVEGECNEEEQCGGCKFFHRGRGWLDGSCCDEDNCEIDSGYKPIIRPPQSWQYCEELEEKYNGKSN